MKFLWSLSILIGLIIFLSFESVHHTAHNHMCMSIRPDTISDDYFPSIGEQHFPWYFKSHPSYVFDGFDYPVGKPNASGYFKALRFLLTQIY